MTTSTSDCPPGTVPEPNEDIRRALVQKVAELPYTELELIREYIRLIEELRHEETKR